ncbi:MAG TPA: hypothetical protein VM166_12155 [Gemmatimonadaceae bacterium]|nr:hypothetical protein [Gemmatimonadaceae bacterium]
MRNSYKRLPTSLADQVLRGIAVIIVGGLAACDLITAPLPADAERFEAPAVYARWWAMTEACSGLSGNLGAVRWYRVPGEFIGVDGQALGGYWQSRSNRIVLAEGSVERGSTVRHEMLHAILRVGGHPRSQFLAACASLVNCQGSCVTDAGRWHAPSPDYTVVSPESLDVGSRVELRPRESDGQRWVTLEISVRNSRGKSVFAASPPGDDPVLMDTFGFDVRGPTGGVAGGEVAGDSSVRYFAPFETKRWLFEFLVASDLSSTHITTGNNLLRGEYGRHRSPDTIIVVSP